jgi:hypothetical protein
MGHDIKIHRGYYRLPDDIIQIAKLSKLLLHLENGNAHKLQGKSLDEVVNIGQDGKTISCLNICSLSLLVFHIFCKDFDHRSIDLD